MAAGVAIGAGCARCVLAPDWAVTGPPSGHFRARRWVIHYHDHQFVFTGADGGLLRRSNFRRRVWLPAIQGDPTKDWAPLFPGLHFHDLRHTHKTWLIEDGVPEVAQHKRMGQKLAGVRGIYSHVTPRMIDALLAGLQRRWEQAGSTNAA